MAQADPPSVEARASALAQAGRGAEAVQLLEDAAAAGDPEPTFILATLKVAGQMVPRDLDAAKALFGRAAGSGHPDAAHVHAAFVTHGAGGVPDWKQGVALLEQLAASDDIAARQLRVIQAMPLTGEGDPQGLPQPERLSDSPDVVVFRRLFTEDECAFLVESAAPLIQPALVTDRSTGVATRMPDRTAGTAGFSLMAENPAVHALNRRLAAASGTTAQQGEPLQVLRYDPGQEYRPHFDILPPGGNQRCLTFLVYLNEGYDGGETAFLKTDLKFKGGTGDGILFRNAFANGDPDPAAYHAGLPVLSGTKMLASRWIREKPVNLYNPLL